MKVRILFASELPPCPDCGEPYCKKHKKHFADCECIGPSNAEDEGYKLVEENGIPYGVKA